MELGIKKTIPRSSKLPLNWPYNDFTLKIMFCKWFYTDVYSGSTIKILSLSVSNQAKTLRPHPLLSQPFVFFYGSVSDDKWQNAWPVKCCVVRYVSVMHLCSVIMLGKPGITAGSQAWSQTQDRAKEREDENEEDMLVRWWGRRGKGRMGQRGKEEEMCQMGKMKACINTYKKCLRFKTSHIDNHLITVREAIYARLDLAFCLATVYQFCQRRSGNNMRKHK